MLSDMLPWLPEVKGRCSRGRESEVVVKGRGGRGRGGEGSSRSRRARRGGHGRGQTR